MKEFLAHFIQLIQSYGIAGLVAVSFAESSFFPIPPDVLLIPMAIMNRKMAVVYALITTAASVLGGMFGHILGKKFGKPLLRKFFKEKTIDKVKNYFERYGGWSIAIAGFTPIPYKVFTISAGAFNVSVPTLVFASILGRGGRFLLEGLMIFFLGDTAKYLLSNYFEAITISVTVLCILGYYIFKKLKTKGKVNNTGIVSGFKQKYNKLSLKFFKYRKLDKSMIYLLIGICLSLISLFSFLELVEDYARIGNMGFDAVVSNYVISIRSEFLTAFFKIITSTGNFLPVLIISITVTIILVKIKRKNEAMFFLLNVLGIWMFNEALKSIFRRPRPKLGLIKVEGYSFPSGHAMIFMGLSLLIIYYLISYMKNKKKALTFSILILTYSILIGLSRPYLGVHYFSDILAGWMVAVLWVSTIIIIYRIFIYSNNTNENPIANKKE